MNREIGKVLLSALTPCLVGGLVLTSMLPRGASGWAAVVFGLVPAGLCLLVGGFLLAQVAAHWRAGR